MFVSLLVQIKYQGILKCKLSLGTPAGFCGSLRCCGMWLGNHDFCQFVFLIIYFYGSSRVICNKSNVYITIKEECNSYRNFKVIKKKSLCYGFIDKNFSWGGIEGLPRCILWEKAPWFDLTDLNNALESGQISLLRGQLQSIMVKRAWLRSLRQEHGGGGVPHIITYQETKTTWGRWDALLPSRPTLVSYILHLGSSSKGPTTPQSKPPVGEGV